MAPKMTALRFSFFLIKTVCNILLDSLELLNIKMIVWLFYYKSPASVITSRRGRANEKDVPTNWVDEFKISSKVCMF